MRSILPLLAGIAIGAAAFFSSVPEAQAWGCQARGNGSSVGWSNNYGSRRAAAQRALWECQRRPRAGRCVITYCDPYR